MVEYSFCVDTKTISSQLLHSYEMLGLLKNHVNVLLEVVCYTDVHTSVMMLNKTWIMGNFKIKM